MIALAIGLSACAEPVEDARPGQPMKTRQTAFKEMLRVLVPKGFHHVRHCRSTIAFLAKSYSRVLPAERPVVT